EVQNNNRKYSCVVGGWCSSDAAWAYEPGVGAHWGDAWTDLGLCAIGPEVGITSPADNALLAVGTTISINVDAADGDGTVESVEFFAAALSVHTDTTAPYSASWTVSGLGEVQLKAVATDNEGNTGDATVLVNVTDETLIASLTSPASGTIVTLGKTVALAATATSIDSVVAKVEFVVNGSVVATDTTAPYNGNWTPGSTGQYSVSAKATDANGQTALTTASTVNVITTPVNGPHQLIGYWHNFINGSGCPIELGKISTKWDVIDIAFADNDRNSTGTVHFNLFAGKPGCAAIDPAQFKLDIAALIAQGKQVVLSLGGAEGTITLNTATDEANFVSSLTALINEWGFSGLDIDLESGSNLVHGSQIQARLPRALKAIEA
ncbi:MAG: Ig-like domain-containing protein, partial [Psychrosphaera sp.]|nr:Ig-like domain-containing protein [Psychrosphaera sp.]